MLREFDQGMHTGRSHILIFIIVESAESVDCRIALPNFLWYSISVRTLLPIRISYYTSPGRPGPLRFVVVMAYLNLRAVGRFHRF